MDNIIVGETSFEEHHQLLKDVLAQLHKQGNLTVKNSKVNLCQRSLHFVGHVLVDGISLDNKKVETICNGPIHKGTRIFAVSQDFAAASVY